jgi:probable HAF family extracellular repeat protein
MVDLGNLGGTHSLASDVNTSGQVVGQSSLGAIPGQARGFSWTAAGGLVGLGTLGGDYSGALARTIHE